MIVRGLSGSLVSHEAFARTIPRRLAGDLDEAGVHAARRRLRSWYLTVRSALGPTAGARTVFDVVAAPLAELLGFRVTVRTIPYGTTYGLLETPAQPAAVLLATAWGSDLASAWRDAVRRGIGHDVRWCLCTNGPALRLLDAARVYSRRFAEVDLSTAMDDEDTFRVLWGLLRADALTAGTGGSVLERALELCETHRAVVRESLKSGVREALGHFAAAFLSAAGARRSGAGALDESLTVIYRVLFLLFAEARGLVPHWHPVYREGYTLESLRASIEGARAPHGLWEALQAIARLAHRGCRAGTLTVPPFNGRLFSPAAAPLAESVQLDDEGVRRALLALTTRRGKDGLERIAYADLGVEQLGAVYEHVLDFTPSGTRTGTIELKPSGRRKATGSFYTPRPLTEYLVRRTLAPLVEGATPEAILQLRIVDPAMGSGAFLVAACRYLAQAYEHAVVREGGLTPSDIQDRDRIGFRRTIAQRCLYGVDINPMAVQLARLSLWLATLASDRPLTFLDHHLRTGDSLVGASVEDVLRQPPGGGGRRGRAGDLPLFAGELLESGLRAVVPMRLALAEDDEETLEHIRRKERTLAAISDGRGPVARWKAAADLWCAGWFVPAIGGRTFGALLRDVLEGTGPLPSHVSAPLLREAVAAARARSFFHWTLEFPEAFYAGDGTPLGSSGFDAVIGNPPWEMLRAGGGASGAPDAVTRFSRQSGVYRLQGGGHANLYQLFAERAVSLVKPGGRLGFILPSGIATDHGCTALRRTLLETTSIDTFVGFENRDGIFPVHRALRFTLLTLTRSGTTAALPMRAGVRSPDALEKLPDTGVDPAAVQVPVSMFDRLRVGAGIPDVRSQADLRLVASIASRCLPLGDPDGWHVRFGRELNATDDRPHFSEAGASQGGLPVVEGKHVQPFRVAVDAARFCLAPAAAARLLQGRAMHGRARLAYRDVASASNRLTLIAAIVPAGVVTTHTLFCLKDPLDEVSQLFLCGMFNSFVANYLVRMRVGTHVTTGVVDALPVPRPAHTSAAFRRMAALARRLGRGDISAAATHQALAAKLYGVDESAFAHVLDGFPLVPRADRQAAMRAFRCIVA